MLQFVLVCYDFRDAPQYRQRSTYSGNKKAATVGAMAAKSREEVTLGRDSMIRKAHAGICHGGPWDGEMFEFGRGAYLFHGPNDTFPWTTSYDEPYPPSTVCAYVWDDSLNSWVYVPGLKNIQRRVD